MTTALWCLLGFAAWTLLLVGCIGTIRVWQIFTGQKRPGEFPAGVPHGGDAYWRLNRAHLNCAENLPVFGAVVAAGTFAGITWPYFGTLATIYLAARIVQSLIHVASGTNLAVRLRFTAFCVQIFCLVRMMLLIVEVYA